MIKKTTKIICEIVICLMVLLSCFACSPDRYGKVYTLGQAYEQGFLSYEDLKNISYHSNYWVNSCERISEKNLQELNTNNAEKMKRAYATLLKTEYDVENAKASGVTIKRCYGVYQNRYAAVMFSGYRESKREDRTETIDEQIQGYYLNYKYTDEQAYIWVPSDENDGRLYTVKQAYSDNIYPYVGLDVLDIARLQNSFAQRVDFTPKELEPKTLSAETEKKIKKSIAQDRTDPEKHYWDRVKESDVTIKQYFGTYDRCVAYTADVNGIYAPTVMWEYTVDGVLFYTSRKIEVWVEKE